jgi:putative RNA 2'-phosphotransferase
MDPVVRHSKYLSWLLRHGALEEGLDMDPAGWASVSDVLELSGMDRATLERVVAQNNKQRLQLQGDRIRATQGHSLAGTPVTREALEASWARVEGRTDPLWHGTRRALLEAIAREGLQPMERTHVHLAGGRADKVGKRHEVEVLVAVDPVRLAERGLHLFQSDNGVFLVREVPPDCIAGTEGR